ncbi:MAG: L-serine ammonia-lyase [Clostridia bacterium]
MKSLKQLYIIGNGPSSSHTMGPEKAARIFKEKNKFADRFEIYLYGSLALTGKGHLTDYIIKKTLYPIETNIHLDTDKECNVHPNTMDLEAYIKGEKVDSMRVYSVGGSAIKIEGEKEEKADEIYKLNKLEDIISFCISKKISLYEYVYLNEGEDIILYLANVWKVMKESIQEGLSKEGYLPGKLKLKRRAKSYFEKVIKDESLELMQTRLLSAYAFAVNETNASGGKIVTAPTCGASGVLPATLYYMQKKHNYLDSDIINALAVAGLIGNLIKQNASISGAECGCQAEVGSACSMAAAAYAQLLKLELFQIENAAETAMEHHLGLTCDPIYGYVQIPCIERNAVASMRAVDAANLASLSNERGMISFDMVVETMYETGKDLNSHYRETSKGGLAKKYCRNKFYNAEMQE